MMSPQLMVLALVGLLVTAPQGGPTRPDTVPATKPDTVLDNAPGAPGPEAQPDQPTAVDPAVKDFLGKALQGLSDNDVVKAACKTTAALAHYEEVLGTAGKALQQWKGLSNSFSARGVPVADLGAGIAASAYAKAVELGAKAESYSLTFGLGSMCNTSETARLAQQQFDFLHNVVNRSIQVPLPSIAESITETGAAITPVPTAEREARFERIFGRLSASRDVALPDLAIAAVDSTTAEAYLMATRADSVAVVTLHELTSFAAEVQSGADTTSLACRKLAGSGDAGADAAPPADSTSNVKCGPLSPGRADQITASVLFLNATQLALTNQLIARRMDIEAVRAQADVRQDFLQRLAREIAPTP